VINQTTAPNEPDLKSVGVAWRDGGVCYVENKAEEAGAYALMDQWYVRYLMGIEIIDDDLCC